MGTWGGRGGGDRQRARGGERGRPRLGRRRRRGRLQTAAPRARRRTWSGSGSVGRPSGATMRSSHAAVRRYSAIASPSRASSWAGGRRVGRQPQQELVQPRCAAAAETQRPRGRAASAAPPHRQDRLQRQQVALQRCQVALAALELQVGGRLLPRRQSGEGGGGAGQARWRQCQHAWNALASRWLLIRLLNFTHPPPAAEGSAATPLGLTPPASPPLPRRPAPGAASRAHSCRACRSASPGPGAAPAAGAGRGARRGAGFGHCASLLWPPQHAAAAAAPPLRQANAKAGPRPLLPAPHLERHEEGLAHKVELSRRRGARRLLLLPPRGLLLHAGRQLGVLRGGQSGTRAPQQARHPPARGAADARPRPPNARAQPGNSTAPRTSANDSRPAPPTQRTSTRFQNMSSAGSRKGSHRRSSTAPRLTNRPSLAAAW
jgi:hypothetical protein